jgi:predicted nucleotidyltransferase
MNSANILRRVHIGEVVRNAVLFNPESSRERALNSDKLINTVARFFSALRECQIEYVLVGSIALLQYVEGRNTEDIDLIMALSSLERIPELTVESRDQDFARANFGELRVDVLLTSDPLFDEVRQRYTTTQRFVEQDIPCTTVEGLILLKLYALPSLDRQGDFTRVGLYENDVATLLQAYHPPVEQLLAQLVPYLSEGDMAQVSQIIAEIQQRISRFEGRG